MIFCLLRHFAANTSHFQLKVLWGLGTQTLVPKNIFQVLLLRTNTGQGQRVHVLSIWRNKFWNFSHLAKTWWHLPEFKVCTSLPKKVSICHCTHCVCILIIFVSVLQSQNDKITKWKCYSSVLFLIVHCSALRNKTNSDKNTLHIQILLFPMLNLFFTYNPPLHYCTT